MGQSATNGRKHPRSRISGEAGRNRTFHPERTIGTMAYRGIIQPHNAQFGHAWRTSGPNSDISVRVDESVKSPKPDQADLVRKAREEHLAVRPPQLVQKRTGRGLAWVKLPESDISGRPVAPLGSKSDKTDKSPKPLNGPNVRVFRFSVKTDKSGKTDIRRTS
jgi:hypothetical protein